MLEVLVTVSETVLEVSRMVLQDVVRRFLVRSYKVTKLSSPGRIRFQTWGVDRLLLQGPVRICVAVFEGRKTSTPFHGTEEKVLNYSEIEAAKLRNEIFLKARVTISD